MFQFDDDDGVSCNLGTTGPEAEDGFEGLRAQLDQKDNDLMLAAELGKALLEKNSDLEKKLELSSEEYSNRIEVNYKRRFCVFR